MISFQLNLLPRHFLYISHRLSFFWIFLVTGLCNSSGSCSFTVIAALHVAIASDPAVLSKNL